jgi:hypothetical protein
MDDKIEKIAILAKLCVICDMQVKLHEDKKKLEEELEQIEKDERKDNHH